MKIIQTIFECLLIATTWRLRMDTYDDCYNYDVYDDEPYFGDDDIEEIEEIKEVLDRPLEVNE